MSYSDEVLADSPLVYYRLDETLGTTLVDSSGNARDGVYEGTPALGVASIVPGADGTCADFSGDDIAYTGSAAWMDVTDFTVEGWFVADTISGERIIASRTNWSDGPSGDRSWHLFVQDGQTNVGLTFTDGTYHDAKVGPALTAGTLYHIALTWDGTTVSLYLDGDLAWSTTAFSGKTLRNAARDLCISCESHYRVLGRFDGRLDEIALYGTALPADRIATHYTAGASVAPPVSSYPAEVLTDSPLAYWRLGEASGTVLVDSSGNDRHGTWGGSPVFGVTGLLTGDPDTAVDFTGATHARVVEAPWQAVAAMTVECWVNLDTLAGEQFIFTRDDQGGILGNRAWTLWTTGGKARFGIFVGGGYADAISSASLAVGVTHHLVGTYDGANIRVYVDGVLSGTTAKTGAVNTPPYGLSIGASRGPLAFVDGRIDEAAFYGTALSDARVAAHYTAGTTAPSLAVELAATLTSSGTLAANLTATRALAGTLAAASTFTADLSVVGRAEQLAAVLVADSTLATNLSVRQQIAAVLAGNSALSAALTVQGKVLLSAALAGEASLIATLRTIAISEGDLTFSNQGYNYTGAARVFYDPPVAPEPAGVGRAKVKRVHQSLPAPTLVDGRPT